MVPLHPCLVVESFARNPNLTDSQMVLVLASINDKLDELMKDTGMAQVYFTTRIEKFANICERHGWEKYMYDATKNEWLMRKRITDPSVWAKELACRESSTVIPIK
jgi:hypothetical protein